MALGEHIVISFTALAIAFTLSLAADIWAAWDERVFRWAIALTGFTYTIPTLAFPALLIPAATLESLGAVAPSLAVAASDGRLLGTPTLSGIRKHSHTADAADDQ